MPQPVVAIVGRPNVGKSTLFNRIVGARVAVVHDEPGITRDRLGRSCEWNGRPFLLVDTGGWVPGPDETMDAAILDQVVRALEACDLVIFLVDARAGVHPHDEEIAQALFRRDTPVLLVANKSDSPKPDGPGRGVPPPRLRRVLRRSPPPKGSAWGSSSMRSSPGCLPARAIAGSEPEAIRVAVLGRPNVGKSSLVNRLLREERMIVDDRPGTTRDAVDSPVRFHGRTLVLVDTAGLRRRLDSQPAWEFYASLRALRSLDRADVAVLVLDASQEIQKQDARIADRILQSGAGCAHRRQQVGPGPRRTTAPPEPGPGRSGRRIPFLAPRADGVHLRPDGAAGEPHPRGDRAGLRGARSARSPPRSGTRR